MAYLKTEALVLRTHRYSESSLVATLLSPQYGRLDVLAKGCRREKSPMFGHLDLYQLEEVLVLERSQGGLNLLIETGFVDEHTGLRFFPAALAAAGVLADVAVGTCQPRDPQPEVFSVLTGAFGLLSRLGEPSARAGLHAPLPLTREEKRILVGRTLKLAMLDMFGWLGFGLELGACVTCGSPAKAGDKNWLSRTQGGLVCGTCRHRHGDCLAIRPAALASLRERGESAEQWEIRLPEGERRRWLRFLLEYGQYVMEKPIRGKKVLTQLLDRPSTSGATRTRAKAELPC